jgi:signal transduction histidine kinase
MLSRDRNDLIAPAALLLLAGGGIAGWLATDVWSFLSLAVGCALGAAALAIGVGWRLGNRVLRLEQVLQNGERMRVLGQVAGGLAHQLRNGVARAKLATQLHARVCANGDGESLGVARRQLARVEADLARFLDIGRGDLPRRPCRVVEIVEEAAALLRPQCRHAEVQLCWEPPAVDPIVQGDPGRLAHIVVNLLTNGVEAAGPGGHVEVTVDIAGSGPCVIEVWDSGPGPNAKIARRLFQPFATGRSDGVGLGLYVARQAAEAHGGRLDWRRERGRTCFRVYLPATAGESIQQRAVAAVPG